MKVTYKTLGQFSAPDIEIMNGMVVDYLKNYAGTSEHPPNNRHGVGYRNQTYNVSAYVWGDISHIRVIQQEWNDGTR